MPSLGSKYIAKASAGRSSCPSRASRFCVTSPPKPGEGENRTGGTSSRPAKDLPAISSVWTPWQEEIDPSAALRLITPGSLFVRHFWPCWPCAPSDRHGETKAWRSDNVMLYAYLNIQPNMPMRLRRPISGSGPCCASANDWFVPGHFQLPGAGR